MTKIIQTNWTKALAFLLATIIAILAVPLDAFATTEEEGITPAPQAATGSGTENDPYVLQVGGTQFLGYTIDTEREVKNIKWSSDNPDFSLSNATGNKQKDSSVTVTANASGAAEVTVSWEQKGFAGAMWWDESRTFYIRVQYQPSNITFDLQGGEWNETSNVFVTEDGKLTSFPENPTRDTVSNTSVNTVYTFAGWNTSADGFGSVVNANTTFATNTTVYAQWTADIQVNSGAFDLLRPDSQGPNADGLEPGDVVINKSAEWADPSEVGGADNIAKVTFDYNGIPVTTGSDVIIILDNSGSMKDDDRYIDARNAVSGFASSLLGSGNANNNRVAFVEFESSVENSFKFVNNLDAFNYLFADAIEDAPGGGTDYTDALKQAISLFDDVDAGYNANDPTRPKHIIFISDGAPGDYGTSVDDSSWNGTNQSATLIKDGVTIHSIGLNISDENGKKGLKQISSDKDFVNVTNVATDLKTVLDDIANNIRYAASNAVITDAIADNFTLWTGNQPDYVSTENGEVVINVGQINEKDENDPDANQKYFYIEFDGAVQGELPTNDWAQLTYTDVDGNSANKYSNQTQKDENIDGNYEGLDSPLLSHYTQGSINIEYYYQAKGTNEYVALDTVVTSTVKDREYAKKSNTQYNVDGETSLVFNTYTVNGQEFAPAGYTVIEDNNFNGDSYNLSETVTLNKDNRTLTVRFLVKEAEYTVTYHQNHVETDSDPFVDGENVSTPYTVKDFADITTFELPTGKSFVKWTYNQDGTGDEVTSPLTITGNVNLYAQYDFIDYTVTYVDGVDSEVIDVPTGETGKHYGDVITVSDAIPTRVGYIFTGWTTTDATIDNDEFDMPAKDVVLTATWDAQNFTVTYDDGVEDDSVTGMPNPSIQIYAFGDEVTVATAPTREGYTFEGWTTNAVTIENGKFTMPAVNVELTAKWTIKTHTISFEDESGNVIKTTTAAYNTPWVDASYKAANQSKEADAQYTYTFEGWAEKGDNTQSLVTKFPNFTKTVTYVPVFSRVTNEYTVTFYDTDGNVEKTITDVPYGTAWDAAFGSTTANTWVPAESTLTIGTNEYFTGWSTTASGTVGGFATTVTGDLKYYAQKADKITVTFSAPVDGRDEVVYYDSTEQTHTVDLVNDDYTLLFLGENEELQATASVSGRTVGTYVILAPTLVAGEYKVMKDGEDVTDKVKVTFGDLGRLTIKPSFKIVYEDGVADKDLVSAPTDSEYYEVGEEITLATNTFNRQYYTFVNWNIANAQYAQTTGIYPVVANSGTLHNSGNYYVITAYAQWRSETISVTFQAGNGGTVTNGPVVYPNVNKNQTWAQTLITHPTYSANENYYFTGWTYTYGGVVKTLAEIEAMTALTEDIVATANFAPKTAISASANDKTKVYDGETGLSITASDITLNPRVEVSYSYRTANSSEEWTAGLPSIGKNVLDTKTFDILVTPTGTNSPYSDVTIQDVKLEITKATLTVTADDKNVKFGDNVPNLTYKVTGFVGNDTASNTPINGIPLFSTDYDKGDGVGEYEIRIFKDEDSFITAMKADNYIFKAVDGKITVTAGTRNISATGKIVTYDGAAHEITVNGILPGDTVYYSLKGTLNANDWSTTHPVIDDVDDSATVFVKVTNPNYETAYKNANVTITKRTIYLPVVSDDQVYTGSELSLTFANSHLTNFNGLADTDLITVSTIAAVAKGTDASTTPYTEDIAPTNVSIKNASSGEDKSANYTINNGQLILTINKATATATATPVDKSKTYDGTGLTVTANDFDLTFNETPLTDEELAEVTFEYTSNGSIYVNGLPSVTTVNQSDRFGIKISHPNYNFEDEVIVNLTIIPRKVTVTANEMTKAYGAGMTTATLTNGKTENFEIQAQSGDQGLVTGESLTGIGTNVTTVNATSNAGTYANDIAITQTPNSNPNYEVVPVSADFIITTVELTVTAEDKTVGYGENAPTLTYDVTGFVNGDDESDLAGTASLSTDYTAGDAVGSTHDITATLGTLASNNYTFKFEKGTLTVGNYDGVFATITADSLVEVYDGTVHTLSGIASVSATLPNGDTVELTNTTGVSSTNATTGIDYVLTFADIKVMNGNTDVTSNYTADNFTFVDGKLVVEKRKVDVLLADYERYYGDDNSTATIIAPNTTFVTYEADTGVDDRGILSSDTLADMGTFTRIISTGQFADVRTYGGAVGLNFAPTLNSNYEIEDITNGSLVVKPRPITITGETKTVPFDGNAHTVENATATNLVNGHIVSLDNNVTETNVNYDANGAVIDYDFVITAANVTIDNNGTNVTGNYDITNITNGWLLIEPAELYFDVAVDAFDETVTFNGNVQTYSLSQTILNSVSGLLGNETAEIQYSTDNGTTWSTTLPSGTDAGAINFLVKAVADNHIESNVVEGIFTIETLEITGSVNDAGKYYGLADAYNGLTDLDLTGILNDTVKQEVTDFYNGLSIVRLPETATVVEEDVKFNAGVLAYNEVLFAMTADGMNTYIAELANDTFNSASLNQFLVETKTFGDVEIPNIRLTIEKGDFTINPSYKVVYNDGFTSPVNATVDGGFYTPEQTVTVLGSQFGRNGFTFRNWLAEDGTTTYVANNTFVIPQDEPTDIAGNNNNFEVIDLTAQWNQNPSIFTVNVTMVDADGNTIFPETLVVSNVAGTAYSVPDSLRTPPTGYTITSISASLDGTIPQGGMTIVITVDEEGGNTPTPTPTPDPDEEVEDIIDDTVPLAPPPTTEEDEEEIIDEEIPLAVPVTNDSGNTTATFAFVSAITSLFALLLGGKSRKKSK